MTFIILKMIQLYCYYVKRFHMKACWIWLNDFSASVWDPVFVLDPNNMIYDRLNFADFVKPSLHSWDVSHLVMVNNPLRMLLDFVCLCFAGSFWTFVHTGIRIVGSIVLFSILDMRFWRIRLILKHLVEFTSKVIWHWGFLFGKFLITNLFTLLVSGLFKFSF